MKPLSLLLLLVFLCVSCSASRALRPEKVECCEQRAGCCFEHMCCLPRYAKAAGVEPKEFTPEVETYGLYQDLDPQPGETITRPTWISRYIPFRGLWDRRSSSEDGPTKEDAGAQTAEEDKGGFLDSLWPF
jgi:hypothetical protein